MQKSRSLYPKLIPLAFTDLRTGKRYFIYPDGRVVDPPAWYPLVTESPGGLIYSSRWNSILSSVQSTSDGHDHDGSSSKTIPATLITAHASRHIDGGLDELSDLAGLVVGSGVVVGTVATQTLTNKTLTSPTLTTPIIASFYQAASGYLISVPVPDAADTVVLVNEAQTLTNKSLTTPTIGSFTNAGHSHQDAAGGAQLDHGAAMVAASLLDDDHTQYRLENADHSHQSTGLQGGQLDHGLALTGLTDDDHTIYAKKASTETISGAWTFNTIPPAYSGSGLPTKHYPLSPVAALVPATNGAEQLITDGTNFSFGELRFDKDTTEFAFWLFFMSDNYDGGNVTVEIFWKNVTGDATKNVVWGAGAINKDDGDTWDSAITYTTATDAAKATGEQLNKATITLSSGFAAGKVITFGLERDADDAVNDTLAEDAKIVMVQLEYKVTS